LSAESALQGRDQTCVPIAGQPSVLRVAGLVHLLWCCRVQSGWERLELANPSTQAERTPLFELPSSSFLLLPVAHRPSHFIAANKIRRVGHIAGLFPVGAQSSERTTVRRWTYASVDLQ
jgi:hypothetical protein